MGEAYFALSLRFGWDFDTIGNLTFPQMRCLANEGKDPKPDSSESNCRRSFRSLRAAIACGGIQERRELGV